MAGLRQIPRTASFAWSTSISRPLVATGTRAGAVDADFSDETKLEIWDLDTGGSKGTEPTPLISISSDSRFYDIAWSQPTEDHPDGVIAGALESGALDLWDASKLLQSSKDALISRTEKHTGSIKTLQFNPHRPELLATAGAKGELYITDLNNASNPYRVGTATARADDYDTLDWNKKVPHILATGSSGGFVTVWDIKAKKESLNLNVHGRKPVSAVAWNPDEATKLATAVSSDQNPLILMWDLRNSSAPERTLQGHDQGVLSLSWCPQDTELLLSCGKDNRNICWNPFTGQALGEFPIVPNWTFSTRWNPRHPGFLATSSFDGKIAIQTVQNTNSKSDETPSGAGQATDGADFFAKAQVQPQGSSFTLAKPPRWMRRPVGVSFGFGGKIVSFDTGEDKKSKIKLSSFVSDPSVEESISEFQKVLKDDSVTSICESRINSTDNEASKEDWRVIQKLVSDSPRKQILSYLGFADASKPKGAPESSKRDSKQEPKSQANGIKDTKNNRLSAFFDNAGEGSNFLTDLAASKGARTNNPFNIFTGSESDTERNITKALMLGKFSDALDICLEENRMSDAFMIAICGGQECIDKAQTAYFAQQTNAPNYLRLLASVVGKNLWDVVYNADLESWKEVMATLCTFADEKDFPDLCEALGDRLEEAGDNRKNASFCYLAGSKLDKVIPIWIQDANEAETTRAKTAEDESAFSIHVHSLQNFIEKVSIFRRATRYEDKELRQDDSEWKLDQLYQKYAEYADVVAAHGHLDLAEQYLNLLPALYPAAEVARNRVKKATKKAQPATSRVATESARSRAPMPVAPTAPVSQPYGAGRPAANSYMPPNAHSAIPPTPSQYPSQNAYPGANPYAPPAPAFNTQPPPGGQNGSQAPPPSASLPPPPKAGQAGQAGNWNDLPEGMSARAPRSRGPTPGPPAYSPYNAQPAASPYSPSQPPSSYGQPKTSIPLPPPPKVGAPPRTSSPLVDRTMNTQSPPQRPPSSVANTYAPLQSQSQFAQPPQMQQPPNRGASPYNPPPSGPPPSNRYAPAPSTGGNYAPSPSGAPPLGGGPRSQYAPQQLAAPQAQYFPPRQQTPSGPPPSGPPPSAGPRRDTPQNGPPRNGPADGPPPATRHPAGDRSHIPQSDLFTYETLNSEMQRVKGKAPATYKAQVDDTEKRLNILFDQMNNEALPANELSQLRDLAVSLQNRDFDQALNIHSDLNKAMESGTNWLVGVKRLISMSKVTPM
ncbi:MAG: protein transport protein S31 [Chrysothrix sp. TS-e1954]|nr:MAG: protein transport protein S31 [Chrysothrix sp. TS-e1954]